MGKDGKQFMTFSVGVYVSKDKTDWCDVSVSNPKQIEIVQNYVKKGSKVLVSGFPTVRPYLSKDHQPMASFQIYSRNVEVLSKRDENDTNTDPVYNLPEVDNSIDNSSLTSDDIPF